MIPSSIHRLVIHHSLSPDGRALNWAAIRRFHIASPPHGRGWQDIGYHLGIEEVDGEIEVLLGRPFNVPGAHAPGANADSLGICLVGDFDHGPVPIAQWGKLVALVRGLCAFFSISPTMVFGHREVTSHRTCPGAQFDLNALRHEVT